MKKFFVCFSVFALFCLNTTFASAACSCTSDEIVSKLKKLNPIEKDSFVSSFFWSSFPSTSEKIAEEISDTRPFRNALKDYINSNCSISNNRIVCR